MIGRILRSNGLKEISRVLVKQPCVSCSSLIIVGNESKDDQLQSSQIETQELINELAAKTEGDKLIYDLRLDSDIFPFSENVDQEYLDDLMPPLESTFNFASYINRMPTLQRLVDLGVNLHVIEQDRDISQYICRLDFDRDIKDHLLFLKRIGIQNDEFGYFITANPLIFREQIKNLELRLEYLKRKKFTSEMVARMIRRYPLYLNFPIKRVDSVLGLLQREYGLTGENVREIVSHHPKVVHFSHMRFREVSFSLKRVMAFNQDQIRSIVVGSPSIFYRGRKSEKCFELLHLNCGYSKDLIASCPPSLTANFLRLDLRTNYLKSLGLLQSDPRKPCFIPLEAITVYPIRVFIEKHCHTSVADFNIYLKSI